jgi:hypothetical protein
MKFYEAAKFIGEKNIYNTSTQTEIKSDDCAQASYIVELNYQDLTNDDWVVLMSFTDAVKELLGNKKIRRIGNPEKWSVLDGSGEEWFSFSTREMYMNDWVAE